MKLEVNVMTSYSHSSEVSLDLVGDYLEMNMSDCGEAIDKIEVSVYFENGSLENTKTSDPEYNTQLESLPSRIYIAKKKKIEIEYLTRTGTAKHVADEDPPEFDFFTNNEMELFRFGAQEIGIELISIKDLIFESIDFDVDKFVKKIETSLEILPTSNDEFIKLQEQISAFRQVKYDYMDEWDLLDIEWDEYFSHAKELLNDPFFWDCLNDFSPNGNDTGADVLEFYKELREEGSRDSGMTFFDELMEEWDVKIPPSPEDEFSWHTYHEAIVGLAFSQIKVEGSCDKEIFDKAISSIAAYKDEAAIEYTDREDLDKCISSLNRIESKLLEVLNQS